MEENTMKKIFALVLAVAMLCTVAFAAAETKAPGAKISLLQEQLSLGLVMRPQVTTLFI